MVVDNVELVSITVDMLGMHQQWQQRLVLYPLHQMEYEQSVINSVARVVVSVLLLLLLLVRRKRNVESMLMR